MARFLSRFFPSWFFAVGILAFGVFLAVDDAKKIASARFIDRVSAIENNVSENSDNSDGIEDNRSAFKNLEKQPVQQHDGETPATDKDKKRKSPVDEDGKSKGLEKAASSMLDSETLYQEPRKQLLAYLVSFLKLQKKDVGLEHVILSDYSSIALTTDAPEKQIEDMVGAITYSLQVLKIEAVKQKTKRGTIANRVGPAFDFPPTVEMSLLDATEDSRGQWKELREFLAGRIIGYLENNKIENDLNTTEAEFDKFVARQLFVGDRVDDIGVLATRLKHLLPVADSETLDLSLAGSQLVERVKTSVRKCISSSWFSDRFLAEIYRISGDESQAAAMYSHSFERVRGDLLAFFGVCLIAFASIAAMLVWTVRRSMPWNLPCTRESIACPNPYGFLKTAGIAISTLIWWIVGILVFIVSMPSVSRDYGQVLVAFFDPATIAFVTIYDEVVLVGCLAILPWLLAGGGESLWSFYRIKTSTDAYKLSQLVALGLKCFAITILPAMLSALTTYYFMYPPGKASDIASELVATSGSVFGIALLLVGFSLVAPLLEELAFRGFLYQGLRRHWGVLPSIIFTSALFSLVHMEMTWWWLLDKFIFGVVAAYSLERSGSLLPALIAHALTNSLAIALLVVSGL